MREPQLTSVPVSPEVLEAADRADALAAYEDFYAEGDPYPVPHELRRERAARFDAEWA